MKKILLASLMVVQAFGQTQIDVARQAKNVDFGSLPFVRPFRTGGSLPATCTTGEMFFLTNATAGSNNYGCSAPNTWTLEGQGNVVIPSAASLVPLQVSRSTPTSLQIGGTCSASTPCNARVGAVVYTFTMPATVTVQSGSGLAYLYVDNTGLLTVGSLSATAPRITCGGCQVQTPISQFPVDSLPLATWNATLGTWDATGTDLRAVLSGGRSFTAGQNIQIVESGANVTISAVQSNSQTSSTTPINPYNPTDMTQFNRAVVFADYGFLASAPFSYSARCVGTGSRSGSPGEPAAPSWLGNANACVLYYPGGGGGRPFVDFLSGNSPLVYAYQVRFAAGNTSIGPGNYYIGWSSASDGTVSNFVGIRYLASANVWQCLITSGGTDVAAATIAAIPNPAFHTFTVSNSTTPNSAVCTIDGSSVTASGTIPAASWYAILGTNGLPSTTYFTAIEARIQIQGISR